MFTVHSAIHRELPYGTGLATGRVPGTLRVVTSCQLLIKIVAIKLDLQCSKTVALILYHF